MERTLIILKPDAVQRGLCGQILSRFEAKGLKVVALKLMQVSRELAERHYAPHAGKPFYPGLIRYITSGPVMVLVLEGLGAIGVARKLMGKTFGFEAEPGTIRGDYSLSKTFNLIHGSDAPDSAAAEIELYFRRDELLRYDRCTEPWTTDLSSGQPQ
ncbi:MAG: nucleoside-diphosphate kinase [Phycisphaerae bacterium]